MSSAAFPIPLLLCFISIIHSYPMLLSGRISISGHAMLKRYQQRLLLCCRLLPLEQPLHQRDDSIARILHRPDIPGLRMSQLLPGQ